MKNKDYTLVTSPPPGSGAITAAILGVMDLYDPAPRDLHQALTWHRYTDFKGGGG